MNMQSLCLALLGPTASGKTGFSIELAEALDAEIICMDSTTVYRGFTIGAAKPSEAQRKRVVHHLVDVLDPSEPFSAFHFVEKAEVALHEIVSRGKTPLVVGGSYFYLRALQNGMNPVPEIASEKIEAIEREFFENEKINTEKMHSQLKEADPVSAKAIHPNDRYRLVRALAILRETGKPPSQLKPVPRKGSGQRIWMKYAMTVPRHILHQNIATRTDSMLSSGLVEETQKIRASFPGARALQSIGYAECMAYLDKTLAQAALKNEITEKTRQLAKRQMTWLRSDPEIRFVDYRDRDRIVLEVENLRAALGLAKKGAA